jgi:hypothetical protein
MNDIAANHQRAAFRANVADRFGVLPNFFCSASAAPGLIERLWDFAQSAFSTVLCRPYSRKDYLFTYPDSAPSAIASSATSAF